MVQKTNLEEWQYRTRLYPDANESVVILEYLGKGSAKNFNVTIDKITETYKAGGKWKYIAVKAYHAPYLTKPLGENKPPIFKMANNKIANKILEYNKSRQTQETLPDHEISIEQKQMFVLDGMFKELEQATSNIVPPVGKLQKEKSDKSRGKAKAKEQEPLDETQTPSDENKITENEKTE